MPERIQIRRARGWRLPPGAVIVDRRTKWGNHYEVIRHDLVVDRLGHEYVCEPGAARAVAVRKFREDFNFGREPYADLDPAELRGCDIACWCSLPAPGEPDICHGGVLLEAANPPDVSR